LAIEYVGALCENGTHHLDCEDSQKRRQREKPERCFTAPTAYFVAADMLPS
jgi:hypothetical protein